MNNLTPKFLTHFFANGPAYIITTPEGGIICNSQNAGQCWLNNRLGTGVHVYGTHCATNYVIANHWSHLRGF